MIFVVRMLQNMLRTYAISLGWTLIESPATRQSACGRFALLDVKLRALCKMKLPSFSSSSREVLCRTLPGAGEVFSGEFRLRDLESELLIGVSTVQDHLVTLNRSKSGAIRAVQYLWRTAPLAA